MANNDEKWYFSKERLDNSPSRQCGIDESKELFYRQQAANFIQDMGQRLKVSQLCINTAIVYMHRFYVFHSFTHFHWSSIAAASIFLAAKVEEQPRKLEHVIKYANLCKNPQDTKCDITSDRYQAQSQDLVFNENILLQTLGFDVAIDHPHTHVVRCCHLVRASKDLAQTSYFMASNSLHLTTMCLKYKPTVVACFCIHLVCKWSNWEIPLSNEKRQWFTYVDPSVTLFLLKQLTEEFLTIFEKCPSKLKEKVLSLSGCNVLDGERKQLAMVPDADQLRRAGPAEDPHRHRPRPPHAEGSSSSQQPSDREREKREMERSMQRHSTSGVAKPPAAPSGSSMSKPLMPPSHHRVHGDPNKLKHRPSSSSSSSGHGAGATQSSAYPATNVRTDPHRDILKEAARDIGIGMKDYHHPKDSADKLNVSRDKRDVMLKPNVEGGNYMERNREVLNKQLPQKYDNGRYTKNESDIKKHLSASFEKNAYANKPSSTSKPEFDSVQRKHPLSASTKSVPNGSLSTNAYVAPASIEPTAAPAKRPSLFSPEKSPPKKQVSPVDVKPPNLDIPLPMSPFISPGDGRTRSLSSSSEPELRPVMKKIDQVEGYENILRDAAIKVPKQKVPDMITPVTPDIKPKELKMLDVKPLVNGIETNPTLISNLLKETSIPSILTSIPTISEKSESKDNNDHHKERKKKNKEKHKHKDKDRSKEDKEKKKKHKDKEREKRRETKAKDKMAEAPPVAQPIKITISKDKIQPAEGPGLKIKIPKDRIKPDTIVEQVAPPITTGGLKIKISKEAINFNGDSRKRDRDREHGDFPPTKAPRTSYHRTTNDAKLNGRHSYGKVSTDSIPPHFNNVQSNLACMQQQAMQQQHFYMYPPTNMPPPPMHNMNVPPPPFMYPNQQMYLYNPGYHMYPSQGMYPQHPMPPSGRGAPPLPSDAPPDNPPPPPPE